MKQQRLTATQEAVVEKIRTLMKEHALVTRPSFLYTQKELLKAIDSDLSRLDVDYIDRYKIPAELVNRLAKELYDILMQEGDHDRAITVANHYSL